MKTSNSSILLDHFNIFPYPIIPFLDTNTRETSNTKDNIFIDRTVNEI